MPGYTVSQGASGNGTVASSSMAVSETSNSDSRSVTVSLSPAGKLTGGAHAVYFTAN